MDSTSNRAPVVSTRSNDTIGVPSTRTKSSGRSQSPRAKERRRLQNRIAQRNHRRRLKESNPSTEDGEQSDHPFKQGTSPSTHQETNSRGSPAKASRIMDTTLMPDNDEKFLSPSWPTLDSAIFQLGANDGMPTPPSSTLFAPTGGCDCNGTTGPCARHLEQIRDQAIGLVNGQILTKSGSSSDRDNQSTPASFFNGNATYIEPTSAHSVQSTERVLLAASGNDRRSLSSGGVGKHGSRTAQQSERPSSQCLSKPNLDKTVFQNTARFKSVLEAARAADFPDFDSMVLSYYTMQFEPSSLPEMMQRASRGRRLNKLLKDLHESSSYWPKWEARGLRESILNRAVAVYVEEISAIANDTSDGQSVSSNESVSSMSIEPEGVSDGSGISFLAQLLRLREPIETAVQDQAPNLWNLITELAGPHGLYCDRVSQAVVTLLADTRRSQ